MAKKILITAITGFRNHGVEALGRGIITGLKLRYEGAQIDVLSEDAEYDAAVFEEPGVNFVKDPWKQKTMGLKKDLWFKFTDYCKYFDTRGKMIKNYDLIVVSGGDMFGPDYGGIEKDLKPLRAARRYGVKYAFVGQSVGRFKSPTESSKFKDIAKEASAFTVRESLSLEYLCGELGLSRRKTTMAPDPAFLLAPSNNTNHLRDVILGNHDQSYISISVSEGITMFSNSKREMHQKAILRLVDYCTNTLGFMVLIIPHVHETDPRNDDSWLATRVARACQNPQLVKVAPVHLSASEYKSLIGASEFCVAERMHAAIAALSQSVTVFCIGYSIKYRGILGDLFGHGELDESLLISVKDFIESDEVPTSLVSTWNKRQDYKKILQSKSNETKKSAALNYTVLPEI